ncbi:MAG: porin family protein [Bacteroidales bacterium]|jgi:hypothetical protein|nr:PorT family protein [Bacteroidales bacterium]
MRIHYKIAIITILFSYSFSAFPQKFRGGFFAGIAASQISGDQLSGFNKAGWYAGGFVNYGFTEKSFLQFELSYILKGSSKNQHPKNNDYIVYKLNLHYVEAALLYKWQFVKRFYLEVGPVLGVLLKRQYTEKDEYGLVMDSERPVFNQFDYCALAGLGINIIPHLKANVRFENSFLPVRKPQVGTGWRLDRWQYNSTISLSVIYEI